MVMPKPLDEMRDPEDRYMHVDEVKAAAGVKIVADGLEEVVPRVTGLRSLRRPQALH
jgi:translation initiation factor eaIF-5B